MWFDFASIPQHCASTHFIPLDLTRVLLHFTSLCFTLLRLTATQLTLLLSIRPPLQFAALTSPDFQFLHFTPLLPINPGNFISSRRFTSLYFISSQSYQSKSLKRGLTQHFLVATPQNRMSIQTCRHKSPLKRSGNLRSLVSPHVASPILPSGSLHSGLQPPSCLHEPLTSVTSTIAFFPKSLENPSSALLAFF